MSPDAKKKLIGALVAAALAIAVYYGLIDQKQADSIKNQADQTLGTGPAQQQAPQPAPPTQQTTTTQTPPAQNPPAPTAPAPPAQNPPSPAPAPQSPAPAPRQ